MYGDYLFVHISKSYKLYIENIDHSVIVKILKKVIFEKLNLVFPRAYPSEGSTYMTQYIIGLIVAGSRLRLRMMKLVFTLLSRADMSLTYNQLWCSVSPVTTW